MKPRFSSYPVGRMLLEIFTNSTLNAKEFFTELGYNNVSKAIESLDCWLIFGEGNPLLLDKIQTSRFAVPEAHLASVMAENQTKVKERKVKEAKDVEQRAREAFVPLIECIPEFSRPTSITMYSVSGGNARYNSPLPNNIASLSWEDQLALLKRAATENYVKHNGRAGFMGLIQGYLYYRPFDEDPIRLTIDGELETAGTPYSIAGDAKLTFNNGKKLGYFL